MAEHLVRISGRLRQAHARASLGRGAGNWTRSTPTPWARTTGILHPADSK